MVLVMLPFVTWTGKPVPVLRSSAIFHLTMFMNATPAMGLILRLPSVERAALPAANVVHGEEALLSITPSKQAPVPVEH